MFSASHVQSPIPKPGSQQTARSWWSWRGGAAQPFAFTRTGFEYPTPTSHCENIILHFEDHAPYMIKGLTIPSCGPYTLNLEPGSRNPVTWYEDNFRWTGTWAASIRVHGYLAYKKLPPPRILQGPMVVPGWGRFLMSEAPLQHSSASWPRNPSKYAGAGTCC